MRATRRGWWAVPAAAVLAVGFAPAARAGDDRPAAVRVQALPGGGGIIAVGEGPGPAGPAGEEARRDLLRKVAAALQKAGVEGEKLQAVMKALAAKGQAAAPGGPAQGQPGEGPKGVMVLQLQEAGAPRDRMAALVRRQQELVEQAGQIVKKMQGLKDGQQAEARELSAAFDRVQGQLRELTQAYAAARGGREVVGAKLHLPGPHAEAQGGVKGGEEKRVIVNVVPKSAGGPPPGGTPAPAAEVKELREQMRALKEQVEDMRALLKDLAAREKSRPKP